MIGFLALVLINAALFVAGALLAPKAKFPDATPQDPKGPRSEEGEVLPVVFGTAKLSANVTAFDNTRAVEQTQKVKTGIFSSHTVTTGYSYEALMQVVLCHGLIDELIDILWQETKSLQGGNTRTDYVDVYPNGTPHATTIFLIPGENTVIVASTGGAPIGYYNGGFLRQIGGVAVQIVDQVGTQLILSSTYRLAPGDLVELFRTGVGAPVKTPVTINTPATSPALPIVRAGAEDAGRVIAVTAPDLFGGPQRGGGVEGQIRLYWGSPTQLADPTLFNQFGVDPKYEGVSHAVLGIHGGGSAVTRFNFGEFGNIPGLYFVVRRCPSNLGLTAEQTNINGGANIAECIYEVLTNTVWGLGVPASHINTASFAAAGVTLAEEELGVNISLTSGQTGDTIIAELLRYADGQVQQDPVTGLIEFTLNRDDYVVASLPVVSEANASNMRMPRPSWAQMVNEVKVIYTHVENGIFKEVPTQPIQDLAAQRNFGSVNALTLSYPGVTNPVVAGKLGARDLRKLSTPLAQAHFDINRSAADFRVGTPFVISWEDFGVTAKVFRVVSIDYGSYENGKIGVSAIEDIFGIDDPLYAIPSDVNIGATTFDRAPKFNVTPVATTERNTGHLLLQIEGGGGRIIEVQFQEQTGIGTPLPWHVNDEGTDFKTSVELDPKHGSVIRWRVRGILQDGTIGIMEEGEVAYGIAAYPIRPALDYFLNLGDGTVDLLVDVDDDAAAIQVAVSTDHVPTLLEVYAGDIYLIPPGANRIAIEDIITLVAGETAYFSVIAIDEDDNESEMASLSTAPRGSGPPRGWITEQVLGLPDPLLRKSEYRVNLYGEVGAGVAGQLNWRLFVDDVLHTDWTAEVDGVLDLTLTLPRNAFYPSELKLHLDQAADGQQATITKTLGGEVPAIDTTGKKRRIVPNDDGSYDLKSSANTGDVATSDIKDSRASLVNNMFRYSVDSLDGVNNSSTHKKTVSDYVNDSGYVTRIYGNGTGNPGDNVFIRSVHTLTDIGVGGSLSGVLRMADAVSRLVPGTTSWSLRNNANTADNILVTDAGAVTFRSTVGGITTLTATSLVGALTGNASTATTLQTTRTIWGQNFNGSANVSGAMSGVSTISMSGALTMTAASSQIIPGATSWAVRNNANSANNIIITDAGAVTFRSTVGGITTLTTSILAVTASATVGTTLTVTEEATAEDFILGAGTGGGGSGVAPVSVRDEGALVTASLVSLNFVGSGVLATTDGSDNVTVTITGNVTSVFGRTGAVTAQESDYSTFYARLGSANTFLQNQVIDGGAGVGRRLTILHRANVADGLLLEHTIAGAGSPRIFLGNSTDAAYVAMLGGASFSFRTGATPGTTSGTERMAISSTGVSLTVPLALGSNAILGVTTLTATTVTAALSGNATTATTLQTSRTLWGQSFNGSANVTGDMSSVGAISMSGTLTMTAAASTVIPGATSWAVRNSANTANNIIIADAGAVTFRSTVGGITTLTATTLAGTLSTAAQPNITSVGTLTSLTLAGALSGVTSLAMGGALSGVTTLSMSSTLTMTAAASQIIPGATSWAVRNNANSANNIIITDAGAVTFRSTVGGITTLTATTLAGTLSTAAQTNITSVGTLTGLTVAGTVTVSGTAAGRTVAITAPAASAFQNAINVYSADTTYWHYVVRGSAHATEPNQLKLFYYNGSAFDPFATLNPTTGILTVHKDLLVDEDATADDFILGGGGGGGGTGVAPITVREEGALVTSALVSLNFVGLGVTATTDGSDNVTVTISGNVASVFGRTGAVTALATDYSSFYPQLTTVNTFTQVQTMSAQMGLELGTSGNAGSFGYTSYHDAVLLTNNLRYSGANDPNAAANHVYRRAAGANNIAGAAVLLKGNGTETGVEFAILTAPTSTGAGNAPASLTKRFRVLGSGLVDIPGTLTVTGVLTATGGVSGNTSTATTLQTTRTIWGQNFNGSANVTGALTGVTTISMSGALTMTAATSQIIPGATSWAVRNNANSADNIIITDAGAVTFRSTVGGITTLNATTVVAALTGNATTATTLQTTRTIWGQNFNGSANVTGALTGVTTISMSGDFTMTAAISRIVPGSTSWSVRNTANTADNIVITDAGAVTFRSTVGGITTLTATTIAGTLSTAAQPNVTSVGTLTSVTTSGVLTMTAAASRIVPGSTSFAIRNNANTVDNILVANDGDTTIVGDVTGADFILGAGSGGGGTGLAPITIREEGVLVTASVASINFVGSGVTATTDGSDNITVTITGNVSSVFGRTGAITAASGDYSSFYPLLNGTGATGTWGISISGSAATLTTTRTIWGQNFNGSANVSGAMTGVSTISMSGALTMTAAVSTIIPGATSWAVRNNANTANNIIITDAGAVTFRSTVGGITTLSATTLSGTLSTAAQPNVTSVGTLTGLTVTATISGSITGNAGTATTLLTSRTLWGQNFNGSANVSGNMTGVGSISMSSTLTMTAAASQVIPGATSWAVRNNASTADNIHVTDAGIVTLRNALTTSGTIRSTSTYGFAMGSIAGVPRIQYGAIAGTFQMLNSSDMEAALKVAAFNATGLAVFEAASLLDGLPTAAYFGGTQRVKIGYNTSSDWGFIASVHTGVAWKTLYLNPTGGLVRAGASGFQSDGRIFASHSTSGDNNAAFVNSHASGFGLYSRGGSTNYMLALYTYDDILKYGAWVDRLENFTTQGFVSKQLALSTDGSLSNYRWYSGLSSDDYILYSRSFGVAVRVDYTDGTVHAPDFVLA